MRPALGRLVSVPLREVWPHEARDFTLWLAEAENMSLLADILSLRDLEVVRTEYPVGSFSIDILARDANGNAVVIENQLAPTNHEHLGQILTYVAGQEGDATVIWIAEAVREEHRAAIDWLNTNTTEGFNFFAVEVEVLTIAGSPPAPWFNVVAKPNHWGRGIAQAARSLASGQASDYAAYWSAFSTFLHEHAPPAFQELRPDPHNPHVCTWYIGRPGFQLNNIALLRRGRSIRTEIFINHRAAKHAFDLLSEDRANIEREMDEALNWEREAGAGCRIEIRRTDLDPHNEDQWVTQFTWFLDQTQRFARVFPSRINALTLDGVTPSGNPTPAATRTSEVN